jgi:tetratricopeptide (TPR) repeat protein
MDISDLSSKIAIIAAFFSSVILFYIFFHASDIYRMSISRISDIRMSLFSDSTKTNLNQRGADSDTFWNSIIPPAYYLGWAPILYTCFISLLCIAGVHYMSCLFLGMALLTIFIFMYIGNTVMKWWSNVLFMVITVGIEFIYPVPLGKTIYGDLLSLILLHHIFYGYRKLFIPSLLCFVAHGTLNVFCFSNMNIFSYVSFFFLLRWRYGLWPVPLILIGGAWALYGYLTGGYYVPGTLLHTEYLGFVWVGFYVLVSLIMKQERLLLGAFKFIAVATIVLFMRSGITPISIQPIPVSQIKQSINNFGNTTKTNVLPGNTFRPLTYMEEPLGPSSSPNIRIGTSLVVLMHYLRKVVVPYPLSFYYGYKFIEPVNFTTSLLAQASLVLYILILIAALYYSKRNKLLSAGLFIYLISIAVFSNYYYPVAGIVGDRYLFYPSLGFALFLCTVLFRFPYIDPAIPYTSWRLLPRIILYPFIGLICLYSVLTFMRNFDWKDKLTLYSHDIKYVSASAQAHNLLALEYAHKGSTSTDISELHQNFELAADQFARSIAIYPSFFNTNYDLGRCLLSLGKPDSALYWFKKSILINTEFPDVYGQIGNIYLTNKQYDSAARYYNMTLALAPTQLSLYQGLLNIYTSQNNKDSAYSVFDRAIHYLPDSQAIYKGAIEYSLYLKDQPNAVRYARQSLSRFNDEYARGVINNVGAK